MKFAWLLTLLLLAHTAAFGRDTAYKALRTLGGERGESLLNRVIEVKGDKGSPQPADWKIVLDDPAARGGVREFEIEKGHIASERTPVRTYSGSPEGAVMNFHKLNLDSEGAFAVAEKQAAKSQIGFDSVDYVLRTDDESKSPVWILRLMDSNRLCVGTIHISADNGKVLRREGFGEGHKVAQDEHPAPAPAGPPGDSDEEEFHRNPNGIGHNIKKGFLKAGASLQEFFTGNRTFDRQYQNEQ